MYLNTLICLEENVAGYGKNNGKPSGHITIMSPGVVKCYIQNLRQLPKEYTVYLISKSQNKAVRVGNINPECMNKQTTWKVDLNNLQGTGVKGRDIDSAAVVVEGNSIGNTDTVLIGYAQGKYLITSMLESALPKQKEEESKPCSCGCDEMPAPKPSKPEKVEKPQECEKPVVMPEQKPSKPEKVEKPEECQVTVTMPAQELNKPAKPGEGPTPVIIPTPEPSEPSKPEKPEECKKTEKSEGPCKVFIPVPDEEKPAKPGEGPCKVFIPTQDGDDAVEIEILKDLQEMFNRAPDKEVLATKLQGMIQANTNPMNPPNEKRINEEEEYLNQIEAVLKSIQESIDIESREKKTLEDKQTTYKRDIVRVRDIFNDSTPIEPFTEKDEEVDWVRISMAELISMPQFSYEWCINPVISRCYYKFGFLILGREKKIEQYYVGIPDVYDTQRQFVLSIDKIESFRGRSKEKLQPGDYGYWIVRI